MYLLYTSFPALRLSKSFYLIFTALQGGWGLCGVCTLRHPHSLYLNHSI